jgi:hypothetical protein
MHPFFLQHLPLLDFWCDAVVLARKLNLGAPGCTRFSRLFPLMAQTFPDDRRAEVIDWLGGLLPEFNLPLDSSDEELRDYLIDGTALCYTADKLMPGVLEVGELLSEMVDTCGLLLLLLC